MLSVVTKEDSKQAAVIELGVSETGLPEAIVYMGLHIDEADIPLGYELFSGNVNDMSTMLPMLRKAGLCDVSGSDGECAKVVENASQFRIVLLGKVSRISHWLDLMGLDYLLADFPCAIFEFGAWPMGEKGEWIL